VEEKIIQGNKNINKVKCDRPTTRLKRGEADFIKTAM